MYLKHIKCFLKLILKLYTILIIIKSFIWAFTHEVLIIFSQIALLTHVKKYIILMQKDTVMILISMELLWIQSMCLHLNMQHKRDTTDIYKGRQHKDKQQLTSKMK